MTGSDAYDEQFREPASARMSVEQAFWEMAIDDVTDACGILRPVYDASGGTDGFVSLEVSPALASDTAATIDSARNLHERIHLPNLFVKIPATAAGVPAIEADDLGRPQHQRHAHLQPVALRRGHRGVPLRARDAGGCGPGL